MFASEFAIDAAHELAMFIWDEGRGHKLTEATYFCLASGGNNVHEPVGNGNEKVDAGGFRETVETECGVYSLGDTDSDNIEATCVSST